MKATCESVLDEIYGSRACHIRAGLIVGPYDPTNRFTYWPVRIAEGGAVLAPDVPETLVQYVDARDLARWMIKLVDSNVSGPMNATGPAEPTSIGETLTRIAAALSNDCCLHWVDGEALLKEGVEPWGELPLWRPGDGTIGEDGLIASSLGHHDQAEYDRQLEQGVDEPQ